MRVVDLEMGGSNMTDEREMGKEVERIRNFEPYLRNAYYGPDSIPCIMQTAIKHINTLLSRIAAQDERIAGLEKDNATKGETFLTQERQKTELREKIAGLEKDRGVLDGRVREVTQNNITLERRNKELQAEVERLEAELNRYVDHVSSGHSEFDVAALRNEVDRGKRDYKVLEASSLGWHDQFRTEQGENVRLRKEVSEVKALHCATINQRTELLKEVETLKREQGQGWGPARFTISENKRLTHLNFKLKEQLGDMIEEARRKY
jgi:hypothetical protein